MNDKSAEIADFINSSGKVVKNIGMVICLLAVTVLLLGFAAPTFFDKLVAALIVIGGLGRILVWNSIRKNSDTYWPLISGLAWTGFGLFVLLTSGGLLALALFMIVTFFIEGLVKLIAAGSVPGAKSPLVLLGIIDMAIAALLYFDWPADAATAVPFLVAINMMSTGLLVMQIGRTVSIADPFEVENVKAQQQ